MIRHAPEAALFPVDSLPVPVIEPALPALLVPPVGGPPLLPPRFPAGSARRSIGGPGHNDGRSKTPHHSRPPGKTVDAVSSSRVPIPALAAGRDNRDPAWQSRSHLQMTLRRFFGPVQKNPIAG